MSDYSSSVKKLNDDLLAFINRYEILDDKDPITDNLLKKLKKLVNSLNTTSNQHIAVLDKQFVNFDIAFQNIYEKSKADIESVNIHLKETVDIVTNKYVNRVKQLKNEISKLKSSSKRKIDDLKQDIEFFVISSDQRRNIFEQEYEDSTKRYEYQISSAKDTYNQSIQSYNSNLEKENALVVDAHKNSLAGFEESTVELIQKIEEKINSLNAEFEEISTKLNNVRNQAKEKTRQESVHLNSEIKVILDEKNKTIVNARTRYSKSQSTSSIEKENNRQEYQLESQKVLKDFVFNITELDEYSSGYKAFHTSNIEKENRELQYKLFDIHRKQTIDIENIIENGYCINNDYDKYTKKLVKEKNKQYYKMRGQLEKDQKKRIDSFEILYQKELENTRHNKALLELDRNYSLKSLNEKEQSDNKYYQELNNIYENDMNLLINVSNIKYNKKANLIKCQSRIRNKDLEKDLDLSEANFRKKLEMIRTGINKHKLEIDGAYELKALVTGYEKERYTKKINNLSVTTLLEIEKCKVLEQFNYRQYQYNVLNSKIDLEFGLKKLDIENQQFEALTNIKIDKIKNALQRDIVNAAYKIKEEQLYELEDKNIQNRNSRYRLDSINHDVLYERFKLEIKIIHQILSTYILLIREIEGFFHRVLSVFYNSISIRPNYIDIINVFVTDFMQIIYAYYKNITNNLIEHEANIISKRLEFEEKFKFKSYYKNIVEGYEVDRRKLLTKQKSINDTLDNYLKTLDTFKSRIYNLENQNNHIKQRISSTSDHAIKDNYRIELANNHQRIVDYKKKINDISKLKEILEKDYNLLLNDIKELDDDYNSSIEEIKKMQYNAAISYYTLKDSLSKFLENEIEKTGKIFNENKPNLDKYYNIQNSVNSYRYKVSNQNTRVIKALYDIVAVFYNNTYSSIQTDKALLLIKFKNDISRIYRKSSTQINDNKLEYDKKVSNYIQELKALDIKYSNDERKFINQLKQTDDEYKIEMKELVTSKNNSMSRFYKEYYAMCDNLDEIISNYKQDKNDLENKFQNDKLNLSKRIISEKNTLSNDLENYIKAQNELINHLPVAAKFQSQQLQKETKALNLELDFELKEAKNKFNAERRIIQKNISNIKQALEQALIENDNNHQEAIAKEKKSHTISIRHISRAIEQNE